MTDVVLAATLVALTADCGPRSPEIRREQAFADARLTLEIVDPRVFTRDDLRAYFVVTNTGKVPLWLNGRMLLGAGKSSSPFNEVWVEVQGPMAVRWWCFLKTPMVEAKHYKLLRPGESAGRGSQGATPDLRCLGLDVPGTYKLTAHYRDGNDRNNLPPAPPGSTYLAWELVAAPATVEITRGR